MGYTIIVLTGNPGTGASNKEIISSKFKDKIILTAGKMYASVSHKEVGKNIALMCKMTGTDLHHIGDAGYPGMAIPENTMEYSTAIRGKRHTYMRMARSINR